jgi:hypothetical protein
MAASARGAQTTPAPGKKYVMSEKSPSYTWQYVIALLRKEPPDSVIKVASTDIASPTDAGMQRLDTGTQDTRPQFVRGLDENLACHVTDCGDWYEARLDFPPAAQTAQSSSATVAVRGAAAVEALESGGWSLAGLTSAAPGLTIGCAALAGAVLGALVSPKRKRGTGAAAGGGCALAVGLAMGAVDTADTSPRTSEVAQGLFGTLTSAGLAGRGAGRVIKLVPSGRGTAATSSKSKATAKSKKSKHGIPV